MGKKLEKMLATIDKELDAMEQASSEKEEHPVAEEKKEEEQPKKE